METNKETIFDINDKVEIQTDAIKEVEPFDKGQVRCGALENRI